MGTYGERPVLYLTAELSQINGVIDFEETVIITRRISAIMINILFCFHVCKWSISFMTMKH